MPLPLPQQEHDGYRGENGIGGWWISLVSAQKRCAGQERWWTKPDHHGRVVPVKQHVTTHNAPKSLPIWLFANGDMYLGEWNEQGPRKHAVEHGFGISYIQNPHEEGLVYIGQWEDGLLRVGSSFWLESSKIWMQNRHTGSPIKAYRGSLPGRRPGIPFTYTGRFLNCFKSDAEAVVTLKNGCTRKGPWESNKPVGDWYHDHHAHVSVTTAVGGRLGPVTARPHDEEVGPAVTPTTSGSNKRKKSSPTTAASSSRSRPSSGNADHDRTSSTIRARGEVAIKQEVIELLDSSSDEAPAVMQEEVEEEQPGEPSQQAVDAAVAFTNNTDQDEDEARIQEIHDWLEQDVIGNNPKPGTMKMYARSLYELGFESVDMITNTTKYLTEQHIDSFKWMKPLHKQMLNDYLHGNDI